MGGGKSNNNNKNPAKIQRQYLYLHKIAQFVRECNICQPHLYNALHHSYHMACCMYNTSDVTVWLVPRQSTANRLTLLWHFVFKPFIIYIFSSMGELEEKKNTEKAMFIQYRMRARIYRVRPSLRQMSFINQRREHFGGYNCGNCVVYSTWKCNKIEKYQERQVKQAWARK